jgi:hypothetical protein
MRSRRVMAVDHGIEEWNSETKSRMEDEMTTGCAQTLGNEPLQFGNGGWNRQCYRTVQ